VVSKEPVVTGANSKLTLLELHITVCLTTRAILRLIPTIIWEEICQVIQCMYFSRVEREIETGMEGHQIQYPMSYGLCNEGDTNEKESSYLHMIKKVLMRYSRALAN
jgi:hypothetical protein